jgi:hypothetical protein
VTPSIVVVPEEKEPGHCSAVIAQHMLSGQQNQFSCLQQPAGHCVGSSVCAFIKPGSAHPRPQAATSKTTLDELLDGLGMRLDELEELLVDELEELLVDELEELLVDELEELLVDELEELLVDELEELEEICNVRDRSLHIPNKSPSPNLIFTRTVSPGEYPYSPKFIWKLDVPGTSHEHPSGFGLNQTSEPTFAFM